MSAPLVSDDLWEAIEPLLPPEPPKPRGGRPRVPDRAALAGIVFALRTGCPWRLLPKELGCGSGWTCWRRLREWQEAGVWERLHERLLNWLGNEAAIDWSRPSADSLSVRYERRADLVQGFLHLACALTCGRFLEPATGGDGALRRDRPRVLSS